MLGSLLGAGEKTIVTPESQFIWNVFKTIELDSDITSRNILKKISQDWRFRIWDVDIKDALEKEEIDHSGSRLYAACIKQLIRCYSEKNGVKDPTTWIDHTPDNIGHIEFLSRLFEDPKFIHIIRDGRGVASSFKRLPWGPITIEDSAAWWSTKVAIGLAAGRKYSENKLLTVRYEDILNDPETELHKICSFAGIEYSENMLIGNGFKTPNYTQSQHNLVGKGIEKSKIESWRNLLTDREIEIFEYKVSEMLDYLGYEQIYGVSAKAPTRMDRIRFRLSNLKYFMNYLRQKYRRITKI